MVTAEEHSKELKRLKMRRYRKRCKARDEGKHPDYYITSDDYLDGEVPDTESEIEEDNSPVEAKALPSQPRATVKSPKKASSTQNYPATWDAAINGLTTNLNTLMKEWETDYRECRATGMSSSFIEYLPLIVAGGVVIFIVALVLLGQVEVSVNKGS